MSMMNPDGNKNTCRRAHRIITHTAGRIEQAEGHLEMYSSTRDD